MPPPFTNDPRLRKGEFDIRFVNFGLKEDRLKESAVQEGRSKALQNLQALGRKDEEDPEYILGNQG